MIAINNRLATVELIFHQGLLLEGREGREMKPCSEVWSPPSTASCLSPPHFLPKILAAPWLGIQGFGDAPETVRCCENQRVPAHFFQRDCSRGSRTGTSWAATALSCSWQTAAPGMVGSCAHPWRHPRLTQGAAGTGIALQLRTSTLGAPSHLLLLRK